MFQKSTVTKLIQAFKKAEKLKEQYLKAQLEAFRYLEEWTNENNNVAIQDVAKETSVLAFKVKDMSPICDSIIQMFENFKEYDQQLKEKRPDFKTFNQEIDASKSILFKTNMKIYSRASRRQSNLQEILYTAIDKMVDLLPDVSSEEVNDISEIEYNTRQNIQEIAQDANNQLDKPFNETSTNKQLYPCLKIYRSPPSYTQSIKRIKSPETPTPSYNQIFN